MRMSLSVDGVAEVTPTRCLRVSGEEEDHLLPVLMGLSALCIGKQVMEMPIIAKKSSNSLEVVFDLRKFTNLRNGNTFAE